MQMTQIIKHNKWLQILARDDSPPKPLWSENAEFKFSVNNEGEDVNKKPQSRGAEETSLSTAKATPTTRDRGTKEQEIDAPTFFFPFSAADNYWPDLHPLLQEPNNAVPSIRIRAFIDSPHITDAYFVSRLNEFCTHWPDHEMDVEWKWLRFEWQARGSIHAHGCAISQGSQSHENLQFYWTETARAMPPHLLRESSTWITKRRNDSLENPPVGNKLV